MEAPCSGEKFLDVSIIECNECRFYITSNIFSSRISWTVLIFLSFFYSSLIYRAGDMQRPIARTTTVTRGCMRGIHATWSMHFHEIVPRSCVIARPPPTHSIDSFRLSRSTEMAFTSQNRAISRKFSRHSLTNVWFIKSLSLFLSLFFAAFNMLVKQYKVAEFSTTEKSDEKKARCAFFSREKNCTYVYVQLCNFVLRS